MSAQTPAPGAHVIPCSAEAERAVLAGILLQSGALRAVQALGLQAADFFWDKHALVFGAMLELDIAEQPIDEITLRECLASSGKLRAAGGDEALLALTDAIPTLANTLHHVRIVVDKSRRRQLITTFRKGMVAATTGVYEDALEAARIALDVKAEQRVVVQDLRSVVQAAVDSARCRPGGSIRTGFHLLDAVIDPLAPGECVLVAGRPGCGKSHISLQFALRAAYAGHRVGVVSVEDPMRRWGGRAGAALHHELTTKQLNRAQLNFEQEERVRVALAKADALPFHYVDAHRKGLAGALDGIDALVERGCQLITLDHFHAIAFDVPKGETSASVTTRAVNEIKGRTQAAGAVLVLVAQLGKDKQGRYFSEPTLQDLRETSQLEIAADVALLTWKASDADGARIMGKVAKLKDDDRRPRFQLEFAENGALFDLAAYTPPDDSATPSNGWSKKGARA